MTKLMHSGNLIIIGFIIAACSMGLLAYKATRVKFDMSTEGDYYAKEISFNRQLEASKAASMLGSGFTITNNSSNVSVSISPELSNKITHGEVQFYCYSNSQMDTAAPLYANRTGQYAFYKATYMKGHNYKVKVKFTAGGKDYYKEVNL